MKGYIAIDGGGTKTELVLFDKLGHIFQHKIISCSNPNDIGMDNAFNNLNSAIGEVFARAKTVDIEIDGILLAIAGIEFGDSKEILKEKLSNSLNFNKIFVDGDLASVKELGLGNDRNGVVVISGTGFNMAIKSNNNFTNIGGWGYLADDYLSGFDLGKDAIMASARAINGVGEDTVLVKYLQEHFDNTLWYSMARIYNEGIKGVATLSRYVIKAYKENDLVAKRIVDKRIEKVTSIIKNKTRNFAKPIKVVLFGGIFENNSCIINEFKRILKDDYSVKTTKKKTIYGAVNLTMKVFKIDINKNFYVNFDKDYELIKKGE